MREKLSAPLYMYHNRNIDFVSFGGAISFQTEGARKKKGKEKTSKIRWRGHGIDTVCVDWREANGARTRALGHHICSTRVHENILNRYTFNSQNVRYYPSLAFSLLSCVSLAQTRHFDGRSCIDLKMAHTCQYLSNFPLAHATRTGCGGINSYFDLTK